MMPPAKQKQQYQQIHPHQKKPFETDIRPFYKKKLAIISGSDGFKSISK